MFYDTIKYPRTYHLPWSPGASSDDKILATTEHFVGKRVIVTEKLDGENTTFYWDGRMHARSTNSGAHPSQNWMKNTVAQIAYKLPYGWRVCGENVYAKHSIFYDRLTSYFYMFAIYDADNNCLSWDDTKAWAEELNIQYAPVFYEGLYGEKTIKTFMGAVKSHFGEELEGYVIRNTEQFHYTNFCNNVAKYVRPNHVKTDKHWKHSEIIPNKLTGI